MSHTVLCVPPKSNLASFKKASLARKLDIQRQRCSFLCNALEAWVKHQTNKQTKNIENFGISSSKIYESYCALCASKLGLLQESEPKVI